MTSIKLIYQTLYNSKNYQKYTWSIYWDLFLDKELKQLCFNLEMTAKNASI